tara:strand:+ start:156120 stop:156872 length:753 start_codon:yes stop_codon:yes gene_type:complete
MIKFFRHIRQRLVAESKFSKYLLYAIGEIILVVIGILIALQINTWNEERKTNANLSKALKALKIDLAQDSLLIAAYLPEVNQEYQFNESLRERMARPKATVDTLLKITRNEFNPNWNNPIYYNTNAYKSLNDTGLIDVMNDSLKTHIKEYYNGKFYREGMVESITKDYREKLAQYVNTYTFGSTHLHDQGELIDSLVWHNVNPTHLAASFQGISNFKRILFRLTRDEMEYSLNNSKGLIQHIDQNLDPDD